MKRLVLSACLSPLLLAGCGTPEPQVAIPAALQPPPGQSRTLEALATGVQVYVCGARADGKGVAWTFRGPEAVLKDRAGKVLGRHFAGPTWEAPDGSAVVGEIKASDPGPDPTAIPWLRLQGRGNGVKGLFAGMLTIQRVATTGGLAPIEVCNMDRFNQEWRSPYTATYYFYR